MQSNCAYQTNHRGPFRRLLRVFPAFSRHQTRPTLNAVSEPDKVSREELQDLFETELMARPNGQKTPPADNVVVLHTRRIERETSPYILDRKQLRVAGSRF